MLLLAIDTSTKWAGVGLKTEDGKVYSKSWYSMHNHGKELVLVIKELLDTAGCYSSSLTHIAVALGPGGFSAIRVGISTGIGLAAPRSLPLIGIPTYRIEAEPFFQLMSEDAPLYALLPAGRDYVAWARFASDKHEPVTGFSSPKELADKLEKNALVCGEKSDAMEGLLPIERRKVTAKPTRSPLRMLNIAERIIAKGYDLVGTVEPIYIRPPSISQPRLFTQTSRISSKNKTRRIKNE